MPGVFCARVGARVGSFEIPTICRYIRRITQDQKSGGLYVTVPHAVYIITYTQITVSLISGSPDSNSYVYRDSTLLDWPMSSSSSHLTLCL